MIAPKVLKGFRDFLPPAEITRKTLLENIERSFRNYGFVPIDTPALEFAEILLGKGGGETEKQIYRFQDSGGRDVALRFDLTVPFARYLAAHGADLPLPFKRYHIAKVWRGENTQRGRYREFTQCDADIVGSNSPGADFEILLVMQDVLAGLCPGGVTIKLNHRGLFNRFLEKAGAGEHTPEVLRIVDKLGKAGKEETRRLLKDVLGEERAGRVLAFIEPRSSFEETLEALETASGGPSPESDCLRMLRGYMKDTGTEDAFVLDPSITRGLDYYTGVVFESFLRGLPGLGSVCSGGRYDNLVGLYSKESFSGVGASIGIDRLIAGLEELGALEERASYAKLAIVCPREEQAGACQALAGRFRREGIPCEVLPDAAGGAEGKRLVKQFMLAEKKGLRWVIIPGEAPLSGPFTLRNLAQRQNQEGLGLWEIAALVRLSS